MKMRKSYDDFVVKSNQHIKGIDEKVDKLKFYSEKDELKPKLEKSLKSMQ